MRVGMAGRQNGCVHTRGTHERVCVAVNLVRGVCAFTSDRTPLPDRAQEGTWVPALVSHAGCCVRVLLRAAPCPQQSVSLSSVRVSRVCVSLGFVLSFAAGSACKGESSSRVPPTDPRCRAGGSWAGAAGGGGCF